jgi:hypothetical protein
LKKKRKKKHMNSISGGGNQSSNMKVSEETISFNGYEKALLLSLEDKFNCVVCEHRYQNPVHLTCGHICCRSVVDFTLRVLCNECSVCFRDCLSRCGLFCLSCKSQIRSKDVAKSIFAENVLSAYQSIISRLNQDAVVKEPIMEEIPTTE